MVFSSPVFIFLFLPLVFGINLFAKGKLSNFILLVFSLVFYAWGEPIYVLLMLFSGLINYWLTLQMSFSVKRKKIIMFLIIAINILLLGVFKYSDFVVLTINSLFSIQIPYLYLPLPIGISFYTFQTLSYVIDVYRDETPAQKNFYSLLLYISFFPQLIAGPIVKYHDISEQIESRIITIDGVYRGLNRFVIGLSKKLLIANHMALIADTLFKLSISSISTSVAWLGALAYLFQIYFDFSGYSDMAIGLGSLFGFNFKENFNYPYSATSIQDFWRRWHISLSSWFKMYVYIPLGGSRLGKKRAILNRIFIFFLTGLWHGAAWTFVVWGLYHGIFLLLEQTILKLSKWPILLRRMYMLLVVIVGFVLFRATSFTYAMAWIQSMFIYRSPTVSSMVGMQDFVSFKTLMLFILAIIGSTPYVSSKFLSEKSKRIQLIQSGYTLLLWILCFLVLSAGTYNPFIYFRF